eukprot:CAMPEP_0119266060 /NCGR_PEP_ID=MMETSP1329-20130426/4677_1 /TAXON_ID=114041 /ORGANISM="Genus nov. species nov., Strain RCC1024" /LENGTH=481 /DNA_ID=CAMNT_0007265923 /DNA_START=144 /DNA_END=1586 /DNA_ORIENTATION=+
MMLRSGVRAFARGARLRRHASALRAGAFPSSDRWAPNLVSDGAAETTTPVRVVSEDEFESWLAAQTPDTRAYLDAAGLAKFKDDSLVLLPERKWAFLTKNASKLFAFSSLPARLPSEGIYALESAEPLPATAALSWGLGCYSFDACKGTGTKPKEGDPPKFASLAVPDMGDAAVALRGTYLCRDLINTPAGDMGPAELERVARDLASGAGAVLEVVAGDALREGYPQIHAVGRAAGEAQQPRLLDMTWGPADAPKVTLVGKGVCFDTGGLDIKPAAAMLTMKKDMGGAAHVLGLAAMVMDAKLPVRLRVLVPAVENAISGDAFRPGDVLVARNGKTTEIGNTDAEGRLVLADALVEACREAPELLIDCATLTGAGRVALGTDVPALFANGPGETVADELVAESAQEQDQVWRLPLWPGYREQIDSKIADLKNIGAGPYGGAITAALYLAEFVEAAEEDGEAPPWLHLDMMAYNTGSKPGRP